MTNNHNVNATTDVDDSKKLQTNLSDDDNAATITENFPCPKCGKSTLHAKFPDQNDVLTTCSSCGFMMGIKIDEWHRMEKSPNPKEHIKKIARRKELIGLA